MESTVDTIQPDLGSLLQEDLDNNMIIYKITKCFRGGSDVYYAMLFKNQKIKDGLLHDQLQTWGENTNGGHESGWSIECDVVKVIPNNNHRQEQAPRLYFDEYCLEENLRKDK